MTKVQWQHDYAADVPPIGLVGPHAVIDVPDDFAKSLLEQPANWKKPPKGSTTESSEEE